MSKKEINEIMNPKHEIAEKKLEAMADRLLEREIIKE